MTSNNADKERLFYFPAVDSEEEADWMNGAAEIDEKFCLKAKHPPFKSNKLCWLPTPIHTFLDKLPTMVRLQSYFGKIL